MKLQDRIKNKSAVISIVGLGYVGLPLSLRFSEIGFKVVGLDNDKKKLTSLSKGRSYIKTIDSLRVKSAIKNNFLPTDDFKIINKCDVIIICVPTPLTKNREPELKYIIQTMDNILPYLRKDQAVSLESTTYPGTTEEILLPRIIKKGFKVGKDFFLIYSPEREDPGNKDFTTHTIPKIISGQTKNCLNIAKYLYGAAVEKVVPVTTTKTAELTKLLENIHRSVNIGLVNEMKIVADAMDIDIHEVIRAASSKPFGFTAYYPGPGLGGHCVPIDPFYLTWKAREFDVHSQFIEHAGEVNTNMPKWVVGKVSEALNERGKSVSGSKILILGVAYKKNVDDIREAPSIKLIELLKKNGSLVDYSDPYVPHLHGMRKSSINLKSKIANEKNIKKYDLVLLSTDHDLFDYKLIKNNAKIIVDTRGVYQKPHKNIVRA